MLPALKILYAVNRPAVGDPAKSIEMRLSSMPSGLFRTEKHIDQSSWAAWFFLPMNYTASHIPLPSVLSYILRKHVKPYRGHAWKWQTWSSTIERTIAHLAMTIVIAICVSLLSCVFRHCRWIALVWAVHF